MKDHLPPDNGTTTISYYPGEIKIDDLQYYLPYGFERDSEYTSLIYCLDRESTNLSQAVPGCPQLEPAAAMIRKRWLIW